MAGKGNRDYQITIGTDDPYIFDNLPEAAGGLEAEMRNMTTGDEWTKAQEGERTALTDPSNAGGRVLEDERDPF